MGTDEAPSLQGIRVCMLVTNDVSMDARVRKEAASVARAGAQVTVIGAGDPDGDRSHAQNFALELVRLPVGSSHAVRPVRIAQNLRRQADFERRLEAAAVATGADVIHANDLDTLRAGYRAARRLKAALLYDAHEISTEGGYLKGWQRRIYQRMERKYAQRADAVITVNRHIAEWLAKDCRLATVPGVVMNGPYECQREARPVGRPVRLLFQGQFGADRNLHALIRAVEPMAGRVVLTLQGWGGIESEIRDYVNTQSLHGTVKIVAPCAPDQTVIEAARHDVGLIVHKPVSMNHFYASPNKLFDYMGAGLAIIASDLPVLRDIVHGNGMGAVFDPAEQGALGLLIEELVRDPDRIAAMKQRTVELCSSYTWDRQEAILLASYSRALSKR